MPKFLVMLDRDGTLIEERHFLSDPDGVCLLPGVSSGLRALQDAGAELVLITNQSGVGRGYFDMETVRRVNDRLEQLLKGEGIRLARVFVCPHAPEDGCTCRKPGTALLERAAAETGLPLDRAYVIGDKAGDMEAGRRVGARTVLVLTGYGRETVRASCPADVVAPDFGAAAQWILHHVDQRTEKEPA